jgi:hypothetical protein
MIKKVKKSKQKTDKPLDNRITHWYGNSYGRIWKTPEELKRRVNKYFKDCIAFGRPFTTSGLALSLGTSRRTLLNYKDKYNYEFHSIIQAAKQLCETYAEESLFMNSSAAGVIFNLKNNHQWIDEQTIKHSGLGKLLEEINNEKESPIKNRDPRQETDIGAIEGEIEDKGMEAKQSILD